MLVTSREYKVILDRSILAGEGGLAALAGDLGDLARTLGAKLTDPFGPDPAKERSVLFLDTPDFTLRHNDLLLRQRVKKSGKAEYTLKCRNEDRYVAAGQVLAPAAGFKHDPKFEEDIGVPFVSRFSHSCDVEVEEGAAFAGDSPPATLAEAGKLYPALLALRRDGLACPPETPLAVVNATRVFEQVYEGPALRFRGAPAKATVAVVVWRKGKKGRLLTAELSFRYRADNEEFEPGVALDARRFFEAVQRADWARPDAITKTQFMYGG